MGNDTKKTNATKEAEQYPSNHQIVKEATEKNPNAGKPSPEIYQPKNEGATEKDSNKKESSKKEEKNSWYNPTQQLIEVAVGEKSFRILPGKSLSFKEGVYFGANTGLVQQ